jgi:adenylate kinase family enzyme
MYRVCSDRDSLLGMTRVLITGMSGTGKSTVLAELARRGHRVVDTDLSAWSTSPAGAGAEQLWRRDAMDALLAQRVAGWLFVAGCASNQGSFYDRFDAVVLLSVPRDVMLQRIATRSTNHFGKACSRAATNLGGSGSRRAASAGNLDRRDCDDDPCSRCCRRSRIDSRPSRWQIRHSFQHAVTLAHSEIASDRFRQEASGGDQLPLATPRR